MRRFAHAVLLAAALAAPGAAPAATLRWAASRDIGSLDPVSFGETFTLSVLNHVYEALVRFDDALKIEPALARRWEVLGLGPTRWRFHLRLGVRFHDGAALTARTWSPASSAPPTRRRRSKATCPRSRTRAPSMRSPSTWT